MSRSINEQNKQYASMRLMIEMSPTLYEAILERLEASNTRVNVDKFIENLENHLGDVVAETISEVTGAAAPFPQEIEVHISLEDESDPVEGFRQAWHDAMTGNVHPASILWDDQFWDSADDE